MPRFCLFSASVAIETQFLTDLYWKNGTYHFLSILADWSSLSLTHMKWIFWKSFSLFWLFSLPVKHKLIFDLNVPQSPTGTIMSFNISFSQEIFFKLSHCVGADLENLTSFSRHWLLFVLWNYRTRNDNYLKSGIYIYNHIL